MFIKSIVPGNHTIHKPTTIILLFKCILNVQKAASISCLVAQSCPTLCDPMDCSTPGFPVPHHLPEFAQVHVHEFCTMCKLLFISKKPSNILSETFFLEFTFTAKKNQKRLCDLSLLSLLSLSPTSLSNEIIRNLFFH